MGIGAFTGLTLYWHAIALLALVPAWIVLNAVIKHPPRARVATAVSVAPVFALLGGSASALGFGVFGGIAIALRHLHDWNRVYEQR